MSAVAGAGTLLIVWNLVGRRGGWVLGLIAASFLGSTYTFWYFSAEVEAYVPAVFWGVVAFAVLSNLGNRYFLRLCGGVICWALAVLFHQSLIFMAPAIALLIWRSAKGRKTAVLHIAAVLCITGLLCFLAYAACAFITDGKTGLRGTIHWATKFAQYGYYGGLDRSSLPRAVIGFGRSIIHGRRLYDSLYSGGSWGVISALAAPYVYTLFVMIFFTVVVCRRLPSTWSSKGLFAPAVLWFVSQAAFSMYFDPANVEWWVIPSVPFVLALFCGISEANPGKLSDYKWILAFTAGVIFFANLSQDMVILNDISRNTNVTAARKIAQIANPGDLVVVPVFLTARIANAEHGPTHSNLISIHALFKDAGEDRGNAENMLAEKIERTAQNRGKVIYLDRLITDENAALHGIGARDAKMIIEKHVRSGRRRDKVFILWPDNKIGKPWSRIETAIIVGVPNSED